MLEIPTPAPTKQRGPIPAQKWDNADLLKAYQAWTANASGSDAAFAVSYGIPLATLKGKLAIFRNRIQAGFHPLKPLTGHIRGDAKKKPAERKTGNGEGSEPHPPAAPPAPLVVGAKAADSLRETVDTAAQLYRDAVEGKSAVSKQRLDAATKILQSAGLLVPQQSKDEGSEFRSWPTAQLIEALRVAAPEVLAGRTDAEVTETRPEGQQLDEFGFPLDPLITAEIPTAGQAAPGADLLTPEPGHGTADQTALAPTGTTSGGDAEKSIPTTLDVL